MPVTQEPQLRRYWYAVAHLEGPILAGMPDGSPLEPAVLVHVDSHRGSLALPRLWSEVTAGTWEPGAVVPPAAHAGV